MGKKEFQIYFGNIMTFIVESKLLSNNFRFFRGLQKRKSNSIWIVFRTEKKREKTGRR